MKKQGALSKIREGEIDNQWFRESKMTIVPRESQESRKRVALKEQRAKTAACGEFFPREARTIAARR